MGGGGVSDPQLPWKLSGCMNTQIKVVIFCEILDYSCAQLAIQFKKLLPSLQPAKLAIGTHTHTHRVFLKLCWVELELAKCPKWPVGSK